MGFGNVGAERCALEATYEDTCAIKRAAGATGEDGITRDGEPETVAEGVSCGLSDRGDSSSLPGGWQELEYERVLFLGPETEVRPGDRVEVARFGRITGFTVVGEPVVYATHQQVPLKFEVRPA